MLFLLVKLAPTFLSNTVRSIKPKRDSNHLRTLAGFGLRFVEIFKDLITSLRITFQSGSNYLNNHFWISFQSSFCEKIDQRFSKMSKLGLKPKNWILITPKTQLMREHFWCNWRILIAFIKHFKKSSNNWN